jgi:hypothetical protein
MEVVFPNEIISILLLTIGDIFSKNINFHRENAFFHKEKASFLLFPTGIFIAVFNKKTL